MKGKSKGLLQGSSWARLWIGFLKAALALVRSELMGALGAGDSGLGHGMFLFLEPKHVLYTHEDFLN